MSKPHKAYESFLAQLRQVGLNLCASFSVSELPGNIKDRLPIRSVEQFGTLLLVGSKGGDFWQYLQSIEKDYEHPLDTVSLHETSRVLNKVYPEIRILRLHPGHEYTIPLQQLGHLAGWGRPSILGLDIHREYGTWFAYRAALLVSEPLPPTRRIDADPVCEVCIEKPCRSACPVQAVQSVGSFDINACTDHRVAPGSACKYLCLSRLACPVGLEYRYSNEQLTHHGCFSLASIKRYKKNSQW